MAHVEGRGCFLMTDSAAWLLPLLHQGAQLECQA